MNIHEKTHVTALDFCGIRIHIKLNSSISQETRTNYLCHPNKANKWVRWKWRFFFSSLLTTNWIYNLIIHTWGSDCSSVEVHELPKISSTHPSKKKKATLLDFDIDNHRGKYQQLHLGAILKDTSQPRFRGILGLVFIIFKMASSRSKKSKRSQSPGSAVPPALSKRKRPLTVSKLMKQRFLWGLI